MPGLRAWIAMALVLLALLILFPPHPRLDLLPAAPRKRLRSLFGRLRPWRQRRQFSFWGDEEEDAERLVSDLRGEEVLPDPRPCPQPAHGRHRAPKVRVSHGELSPQTPGPAPVRVELPCLQPVTPVRPADEIPPWDDTPPPASKPLQSNPPTVELRIKEQSDEDLGKYLGELPGYDD